LPAQLAEQLQPSHWQEGAQIAVPGVPDGVVHVWVDPGEQTPWFSQADQDIVPLLHVPVIVPQ
jgi:hypothetical protein